MMHRVRSCCSRTGGATILPCDRDREADVAIKFAPIRDPEKDVIEAGASRITTLSAKHWLVAAAEFNPNKPDAMRLLVLKAGEQPVWVDASTVKGE